MENKLSEEEVKKLYSVYEKVNFHLRQIANTFTENKEWLDENSEKIENQCSIDLKAWEYEEEFNRLSENLTQ